MPVENRKQASDGAKQADDAKSDGAGKQGSKYLLVVEAGDAKAKRVAVLTTALREAKLDVQHSFNTAGDEIRFVVSADFEALSKTAEMLAYCKPRARDGEMGLFQYELRDEFAGYSEADPNSFWHPSEESALLSSRIGDAVCTVSELQRAGLTAPPMAANSKNKDTRNLIRVLEHSAVLADRLPLSLPRKKDFKGDVNDVWEAYGSEAALYFGWMDHLSQSLYAPGAVGLALYFRKSYSATLAGMYLLNCLDADSAQVYCPLLPSEAYTVDDDPLLPVFSVFVVVWAATFLATWKRKENEYGWSFGLTQGSMAPDRLHSHVEPPPPSLFVTFGAYGLSVAVTSAMLLLALAAMVCSLNLQGYIHNQLWTEKYFYIETLAAYAEEGNIFDPLQTGRSLFGFEEATGVYLFPLVPVLGHVIVILTLNTIYKSVAEWLTSIEPHANTRAAERSMQLKRFFFEAFDCYIALFYLAFVQCDVRRLRVELISIYTIDSVRRIVCESVLPWVLQRSGKNSKDPLGEQLLRDEYESFDDYLEMVIAFGYVTLFASAFPLSAPLTIVCIWVERASDLWGFGHVLRRPISSREATIGVWEDILRCVIYFSVLTNVVVICLVSEQLAAWMPTLYRAAIAEDISAGLVEDMGDLVLATGQGKWVVATSMAIEHAVGLVVVLIGVFVPPESYAIRQKRKLWNFEQQQLATEARIAHHRA